MSQPSFSSDGGGFIDVNGASMRFTSVGAGVTFQDGSEMFSKDDAVQTLQDAMDNGASSSITMDLTNTGTALTAAGDIAVGSSDPEDTRLHVTGNAFIANDLYIDNALAANVVLNVAGGINAANFFGDGGLLTNVTAPQTLQEVVDVGNVSTEVVSLVNNTLALSAGGPVVIGSSNPLDSILHVTGNIHATTDISVGTFANIGTTANIGSHANIVGDVNTQGEVIATHFHGDGSNIVNLANATQNQILFAGQDGLANGVVSLGMTFGTTPGTDANTLTMGGDIITTNLRVTNNLQVTGTVTQIHTDNLTVTDPIVALNEDYTGDVTTGFVFNREQDGTTSNVMIAVCGVVEESGALDEHLVLARTINAADSDSLAPSGDLEVNVFGNVTVSGNIVGTWIHGDGSNLTGLVSDLQSVVDNGNVVASNTIIFETPGTPSLVSNGHIVVGQTLTADTGSANLYVKGNVFVSNAVETNAIHMTNADLTGVVIKTSSTISPSVAIGRDNAPGTQSVAIGDRAGASGAAAVAVGAQAGQNTQGGGAVAMGLNAGNATQGVGAIAVGSSAGRATQGDSTVAVGAEAGRNNQGDRAVAVGYGAGKGDTNSQGADSVAIGYLAGKETIHEKTIILNASGSALNSLNTDALYINPIRNDNVDQFNKLLTHNVETSEVVTVLGINVHASNASIQLSGNLLASNLYGNGAGLTGLATTLQSVTEFGATTDQTVTFQNATTALVTDAGTFTALGGGDGSGTTLHVTGNAHTTGAATFGAGFVKLSDYTGTASEGGHIDLFARGGTDTAPHSSNGWSMDVVDDANNFRIYKTVNVNGTETFDTTRIKLLDDKLAVENNAGGDKVSNLLVSGNVTTNVIYFGSGGGSGVSGGGLDLNNVVSRGAVTETGIIIDTDHSTTSLTAQVVASNTLTANIFTLGGDHIIRAYTNPGAPTTDRALLIGYGGSTDRIGLGEASTGNATFGVYDEAGHTVPNTVVIDDAKLGIGTGFTSGAPNALTEALEVVGNIKLSGDLEATNGKLLVNSSGTQGGEIRLYDHSSGAGYWILDNGSADTDGETDFRLWRTGSSRAAFRTSHFNDASEDDYSTRIGASALPVTTLSVTQTKNLPNATDSAGVGEYALSLESTEGATNAQMGLCFTLYTSGTPGVTSTPGAAITHERVDSFSEGKLHFKTKGTNGSTDSCVTRMTIDENGTVGVGVTSPVARLDVSTGTSTHYLPNTSRIGVYDYFNNESLEETQNHFGIRAQTLNLLGGSTWAFHQADVFALDGTNTGLFGIHSVDNIVTQGSLISSAGAMISSDSRIKKDIVDISDTEALDMVRNLAPKKYRYADPVVDARSNANVIGFIAQEVANVIPGSTRLRVDKIPNIMAMALVTESNVITFDGVETPFDTSTLLATTNILVFKSIQGQDVPANIVEVLGTHSIRVDRDLTPFMGSIDENGVPIKDEDGNHVGDGIFVYGQMVNDFHILKKEVVFATGIAALQEVDRQQVADKARIATLESQVAELLTRVQALENP